jgi:hypothetical protein
MFYILDSSIKDFNGHYLEYALRIGEHIGDDLLILANKEFETGHPSILPIFRHKTWDFGRFGIKSSPIKKNNRKFNNISYSNSIKLIKTILRLRKIFIVLIVLMFLSKQGRNYFKDLISCNFEYDIGDKFLISTSNYRELSGLYGYLRYLKFFKKQRPGVVVILRRPLSEFTSKSKTADCLEALFSCSSILCAPHDVHFVVDTLQLNHYYRRMFKRDFLCIGVPGFSKNSPIIKKTLFLLPNNDRDETRNPLEDLGYKQLSISNCKYLKTVLSSEKYFEAISETKFVVLPYSPARYVYRSSGIFAEALSVNSKPIVPSGTSMSQFGANEIRPSNLLFSFKLNSKQLFSPGKLNLPQIPLAVFLSSKDVECEVSVTYNNISSNHLLFDGNRDFFFYFPSIFPDLKFHILYGDSLNVDFFIPDKDFMVFAFLPGQLHLLLKYISENCHRDSEFFPIYKYRPELVIDHLKTVYGGTYSS